MPKVYIVQKSEHDFSRAKEYGELVYLYDDEHKANVFAPDKLIHEIKEKLKDSTPDDYLILSGSMLPAALTFFEWTDRHGICHNLLYSFRDGGYEVRTVRGTQFDDAEESE